MNGIPAGVTGNVGSCILTLYHPGNVPGAYRQEHVDVKYRDYIYPDDMGPIKIVKIKPRGMLETKQMKRLIEKLEDLVDEEVLILIG